MIENEPATVSTKRRFYSMKETAAILGISNITVFNHCRSKAIPSVLLGHRRLVPRAFIEELAEKANRQEA
jgi:predicted DNA-binding transcriptional regulator AlpA